MKLSSSSCVSFTGDILGMASSKHPLAASSTDLYISALHARRTEM